MPPPDEMKLLITILVSHYIEGVKFLAVIKAIKHFSYFLKDFHCERKPHT